MTEDDGAKAQCFPLIPSPPNCSMPTLVQMLDFLAEFYAVTDRMSIRNDATGEASLVAFGMSLTKPSRKEAVLILGADDEEQMSVDHRSDLKPPVRAQSCSAPKTSAPT